MLCFVNGALFPAFLASNLLDSDIFYFMGYFKQSIYKGMMMTTGLTYLKPLVGYLITKLCKKKAP